MKYWRDITHKKLVMPLTVCHHLWF